MDTYRERLVAPLSWWVVAVAFGLVWGWLMLVASNRSIAIGTAVLATVLAGSLVWSYGSVVVEAGSKGLRVGTAHLPPAHIGAVEALDPRGFREQLGPHADARAWLRTRPYIEAGIRVEVADPSDPTPYWLVSSRRPQALAATLVQTGVAPIRNGEVEGGQEEED
jgi:hypothetical protein